MLYLIPFLHQTTTWHVQNATGSALYLIPFLHQTTTVPDFAYKVRGCILFHFYIKPQLCGAVPLPPLVVSYSISTSNHNISYPLIWLILLYLIPFLHQTTTVGANNRNIESCILFHFYIKPQPKFVSVYRHKRCILFHFYIKPQPMAHKTLFSSTLSPKSHSHFQRNAVV